MLKQTTEIHRNSQKKLRSRLYDILRRSVLVGNLFVFCIGFFIAGASLYDSCLFCGAAFVGALGSGMPAFFGLAGVFAGYIWFYGFEQSILYLGASLFVYTISFIFQYTSMSRSRLFMPLTVLLIIGMIRAYGRISVVRGSMDLIWHSCFEAFGAGLLTYIYSLSLRHETFHTPKQISLYSAFALLATVATGVSDFAILDGISPTAIAMTVFVLTLMYGDELQVYPVALMFGFVLQCGSIAREGAFLLFQLYALADVTPLKKNKLLLSTYCLGTYCIYSLSSGRIDLLIEHLLEVLLAILLFLCIPRRWYVGEKICISAGSHENAPNVFGLAELFENVCRRYPIRTVQKASPPDYQYVFDRALEAVCDSCEKRQFCWEKHGMDSASLLRKSAEHIAERGKLKTEDLPSGFRGNCIQPYSVVLAVNYELQRWKLTERILETEHMNAYYCKQQYQLFARMLQTISNGLRSESNNVVMHSPKYSAEVGFASKRKYGEPVCGDAVKYFKTPNGMLYVILSDGMGSGKDAERISSFAASVIEYGLKLFPDPSTIVELVHLTLQTMDPWATATIDLLSVDLNTGDLTFYKMGASDSYVLASNQMTTVEGNIYSAGNSMADIMQYKKISVNTEAVIVLSSDGAALEGKTALVQSLWNDRYNMKYAARKLLLSAENDVSDDKTVITVLIKKKLDSV